MRTFLVLVLVTALATSLVAGATIASGASTEEKKSGEGSAEELMTTSDTGNSDQASGLISNSPGDVFSLDGGESSTVGAEADNNAGTQYIPGSVGGEADNNAGVQVIDGSVADEAENNAGTQVVVGNVEEADNNAGTQIICGSVEGELDNNAGNQIVHEDGCSQSDLPEGVELNETILQKKNSSDNDDGLDDEDDEDREDGEDDEDDEDDEDRPKQNQSDVGVEFHDIAFAPNNNTTTDEAESLEELKNTIAELRQEMQRLQTEIDEARAENNSSDNTFRGEESTHMMIMENNETPDLPKQVVVSGENLSEPTSYSFHVNGTVEVDPNTTQTDVTDSINGTNVSGVVEPGGMDLYWINGTITDKSTDGNVNISVIDVGAYAEGTDTSSEDQAQNTSTSPSTVNDVDTSGVERDLTVDDALAQNKSMDEVNQTKVMEDLRYLAYEHGGNETAA